MNSRLFTLLILACLPALAQGATHLSALRFSADDYSFKKPSRLNFGSSAGQVPTLDYPEVFSSQNFQAHIDGLRRNQSWIFSNSMDSVANHLEQNGPGTRRSEFCLDTLTPLEALPIRIMERRGILSPARAQTILQSNNLISPANITFIMNLAGPKEIRSLTEKDLEGALKVVSGQGNEASEMNHLPFEYRESVDTNLVGADQFFGFQIDRKKYRYVWEVGRFASKSKQGINELQQVALQIMQKELAIYGGSLDEAFVFGHAITGIHRRLYEHDYGMTLVKVLNENSGESVLQVPLKHLLERSPGAQISEAEWKSLRPPNKMVFSANATATEEKTAKVTLLDSVLILRTDFVPGKEDLQSMIAMARQHGEDFSRVKLEIQVNGLRTDQLESLEQEGLKVIRSHTIPNGVAFSKYINHLVQRQAARSLYGAIGPGPTFADLETDDPQWLQATPSPDAIAPEWKPDPSSVRTRLGW